MGDVVNMHEQLGRVRKSAVLADVLESAGSTADDVLALDDDAWVNAATLASHRLGRTIDPPFDPPSDATKTLVWSRLVERERLATCNPLEGIGMRK